MSKFPQIVHQTSCPYTPQQNGIAERKHRHVVELALATISHASIPTKYWDEIFSSIVFLINRLPLQDSIPYKILFNKDPDYNSLRVLGCLCFPYTRPYNKHKFELRSQPCVFLGYGISQKCYRCLQLSTNRIFVSRNVQFDETHFPFKEPSRCSDDALLSSFTVPLNLLQVSSQPADSTSSLPQPISTLGPASALPALDASASAHPSFPLHSSPHAASAPLAAHTLPPQPAFPAASPLPQSPHSSPTDTPDISPSPPPATLPQSLSSPPPPPVDSTPTPLSTTRTHSMTTRTRDHSRKPRQFPDFVAHHVISEYEPITFKHALNSENWRRAMSDELNALAINNTWTLVPALTDHKVIGCKWVYKVKRKHDGSVDRYKARLVAKGYNQEAGVDYVETIAL